MEATTTVPDVVLISAAVTMTALVLMLTSLIVNCSSARRHQDLSRPSRLTDRTQCPRGGCTIVHPGSGRHRYDPRPDSAIDVFISALACGFGLINVPKGHHRHI